MRQFEEMLITRIIAVSAMRLGPWCILDAGKEQRLVIFAN
jgi:hypothetical protein